MKLLDLCELEGGPGLMLLEATVAMGFSEAVAREGLEAETGAWRVPGALDEVRHELPDDLPKACYPDAVLVIGARTLPVSLMRAVLMARLLGARVVIKPATGQVAVAQAIAAADPAVTVSEFSSNATPALTRAIAGVDAVVVLGSDETVAAVRARVPADKAFVGYGHRLSVAWLEVVDEVSLQGLARDLCAWDQAGCLSPQVAWIREEPARVAPRLAAAIGVVEGAFPMVLPNGAVHGRLAAKTYAEMMGSAFETETALIGALTESTFRPSSGHRCLWLLPADEAALGAVLPHLSTVGVSGDLALNLPERVRVCPVGQMQRPSLLWPHDGRPNLVPMLRP